MWKVSIAQQIKNYRGKKAWKPLKWVPTKIRTKHPWNKNQKRYRSCRLYSVESEGYKMRERNCYSIARNRRINILDATHLVLNGNDSNWKHLLLE